MYSADLRAATVRLYHRLNSLRKVADTIGVAKSSVHRWVASNPFLQRRYQARKLTKQVLTFICQRLEADPFVTCSELKSLVKSKCSTDLSVRAVCNGIRRLGYTRKRTFRHVEKEGLYEAREAFEQTLQATPQTSVISVDETAFCFDMKPHMGYAPKGRRLRTRVHSKRQSKWTLLMAVASDRVVGYSLFKGSCNASKFADFVEGLERGACNTLLLDNVAFHKTKAVRQAMERNGLTPLFLPPYSPQYQPIECVFSCLKSRYRRLPCLEDAKGLPGASMERSVADRVKVVIESLEGTALQRTFAFAWAGGNSEERIREGAHGGGNHKQHGREGKDSGQDAPEACFD